MTEEQLRDLIAEGREALNAFVTVHVIVEGVPSAIKAFALAYLPEKGALDITLRRDHGYYRVDASRVVGLRFGASDRED